MMFKYYFSKGFIHFYCNKRNLEKLPSEVKDIIFAEVTDHSYKVMIYSTTIPYNSNTLKNLLVMQVFILPIYKNNSLIKRI